MLLALVFLIVLQDVHPPDINKFRSFKPISSKELEFRIDDYRTGFVGRVVDYQNINDPSEFVRVYYRQISLVSERAREQNTPQDNGGNRIFSNLSYHQQREAEAISRVQKESDTFAYIRWRTGKDSRTGHDVKIPGSVGAWLLDQNGKWVSGESISLAPLSEVSKNSNKQVIVGIKFTLGNSVHIVRVDQNDILFKDPEVEQ